MEHCRALADEARVGQVTWTMASLGVYTGMLEIAYASAIERVLLLEKTRA